MSFFENSEEMQCKKDYGSVTYFGEVGANTVTQFEPTKQQSV